MGSLSAAKLRTLLRNVPIPEASLAGIAAGVALEQVRPWRLPGSRSVRRSVGWSIVLAGSFVVAWSLKAAGATDFAKPEALVTSGPYAQSRNPMYVGWGLLQLGIGVATGSGWIVATLPVVGAEMHRDVLREERRLGEKFGDEYQQYRATVGRYLPEMGWQSRSRGRVVRRPSTAAPWYRTRATPRPLVNGLQTALPDHPARPRPPRRPARPGPAAGKYRQPRPWLF